MVVIDDLGEQVVPKSRGELNVFQILKCPIFSTIRKAMILFKLRL